MSVPTPAIQPMTGQFSRQPADQLAYQPRPRWGDGDIELAPLLSKNVVMVGYGNQGRPQSLNLRDSGVTLKIGVREESQKQAQAREDGFEVMPLPDALRWADVVMLLLPDDVMADAYETMIAPYLRAGQYLGFGHGLAIHAGWVKPASDINVFLVAPKGQGKGVRGKFEAGSGVPALIGVHQDPTGDTKEIALAYAKAIGCGRTGIYQSSFEEETVCDLFSEQAVLCGGLTSLIKTAFETLVESGYSAEAAYFECLYEVKLIADLLHDKGIAGMREGISSTALFGDLSRGERIIDDHVRENMRTVLKEIQSGQFGTEMREEFAAGKPTMQAKLAADKQHLIELMHHDITTY